MPVSIQHGGDSTIARLESGRIAPSMKTWRRLAAATGTRPKVTLSLANSEPHIAKELFLG
jgi:hypothetical protein